MGLILLFIAINEKPNKLATLVGIIRTFCTCRESVFKTKAYNSGEQKSENPTFKP